MNTCVRVSMASSVMHLSSSWVAAADISRHGRLLQHVQTLTVDYQQRRQGFSQYQRPLSWDDSTGTSSSHTLANFCTEPSHITWVLLGSSLSWLTFSQALMSTRHASSYYGCELWSLTASNISDFCTAWRRGVRAIYNLPYTSHCYLLPLICQCLPVFDELCRRSINFARSCISHEWQFISQIASYYIHFACCYSPIHQSVWICRPISN